MSILLISWLLGLTVAITVGVRLERSKSLKRRLDPLLTGFGIFLLFVVLPPLFYEFPRNTSLAEIVTFAETGELERHPLGIFHPFGKPPTVLKKKESPVTITSSAWVVLEGKRVVRIIYQADLWIENPRTYLREPAHRDDMGSTVVAQRMLGDMFAKWNDNNRFSIEILATIEPRDRLPRLQRELTLIDGVTPAASLEGLGFHVTSVEVAELATPDDPWGIDPVTRESLKTAAPTSRSL